MKEREREEEEREEREEIAERNGPMRFVRLSIDAFHAVSRNVANSNQANGNWRLSSFVYYLNQYYRELQINYYRRYFSGRLRLPFLLINLEIRMRDSRSSFSITDKLCQIFS